MELGGVGQSRRGKVRHGDAFKGEDPGSEK